MFAKDFFKGVNVYTTIFCLLEFPLPIKHENLSIIYPNDKNFKEGLKIALRLRKKGTPIPIIDLLNGVISVEKDLILVTDDKHFEYLRAVEPSLQFISIDSYLDEIHKK
ncbi:MAG: hypothetical protein ACXQS8_00660 [Candidatus Helarchaeales archaeon]